VRGEVSGIPAGIGHWVRYRAQLTPHRPAVADADGTLTWQAFNRRANQLAHTLTARGVAHQDRVAALMWNSTPFLEAVFATAKIGAILVPVNYRLAPPEVQYILHDSGAKILLVHEAFQHLVEGDFGPDQVIGLADPGHPRETSAYEKCLAESSDREPDIVGTGDDIHLMMYTSGTTGRPKGALLSHGNTTWNAIQLMLHEAQLRTDDVVLTVAPLFHIGGIGVHTLPALYLGAFVVLMPRFDPVAVLETIQRKKVSALFMVPAMWQAVAEVPDFDHYDLSSLRLQLSGGAPCPIPVIEFYQSRGLTFLEGFGMTETAPNTMILGADEAIRKHGSIGRPLFYQQARIVDDEDRDVPVGTVGELVLRGPNIFHGYWQRPEATEEVFCGGWFHTGDLARMDDEGFYYLVDRKKDLVISGGENVYPIEVEQVLVRHPRVAAAAVIGVPDPRWGEVPLAVIVPKDPLSPLTTDEVIAFCRGRLAGFKIPKQVVNVEALPRSATGKVLKTVLRKQYRSASGGRDA